MAEALGLKAQVLTDANVDALLPAQQSWVPIRPGKSWGTRVCSLILSKRGAIMGSLLACKNFFFKYTPRSPEITLPGSNDAPKPP